MEQQPQMPEGEFHHFQLVDGAGHVPMSISVLIHFARHQHDREGAEPITSEDVLHLHEGLKGFDGDFLKAFQK